MTAHLLASLALLVEQAVWLDVRPRHKDGWRTLAGQSLVNTLMSQTKVRLLAERPLRSKISVYRASCTA